MTAKKIAHTERKLPPDLDGMFRRATRRAKKVIGIYRDLNPGPAREYLVANLLHDLMHLCDRDETLGDFLEDHEFAVHLYNTLAEESEEMVR